MKLKIKTKLKIKNWKSGYCIFQLSALYLLSLSSPIVAQIVPDTALPNNSHVRTQDNINFINEGTRAGNNLFHSFQEFSLPTGSTAHFNNDIGIQNIISRVTGKSISNIDGLIRSNGTANLFLLNPNGIVFGSNAQLNIGGSFIATTANSINFADGKQFLAQPNQKEPLLTISTPIGLVFKDKSTGMVEVLGGGHQITPNSGLSPTLVNSNATGLSVQPGKTLALIASNVNLEGGIITAPGGRSDLGSVSSGLVSLKLDNQGLSFGYEGVSKFEDIHLSRQALINTSGAGLGIIQVHGANINLTDGSFMLIQNQGDTLSGNINIKASESLILQGTSPDGNISSSILTEAVNTGEGGNIKVSTQRLTLQDGARVGASTYSNALGGNVTVDASNSVQLLENRFANPFRQGNIISLISGATFASGKAGSVQMAADWLQITDGGAVASSSMGTGDGNNVTVNANSIEIVGIKPERLAPSTIAATAFNAGDAGSININTSQLRLKDGGVVNSVAFGSGNAGSINVNAKNFIEISGKASTFQPSFISSSVSIANENLRRIFGSPLVPTGTAGNITVDTKILNITQGGLISVENKGVNNAGTININANTINIINNGGIAATTAVGQGGEIILNANNVLLRNGSISTTAGQQGTNGDGGNITIDTKNLLSLGDSSITANAFEGKGGNIKIDTKGLFLSPNSQIAASSQRGIDGTVEINFMDKDPNRAKTTPQAVMKTPEVVSACEGNSGAVASFINTGAGGIPRSPSDIISSQSGWHDSSMPTKSIDDLNKLNPSTIQEPQIVEAQGLITDYSGTILLTEKSNNVAISDHSLTALSCQ